MNPKKATSKLNSKAKIIKTKKPYEKPNFQTLNVAGCMSSDSGGMAC